MKNYPSLLLFLFLYSATFNGVFGQEESYIENPSPLDANRHALKISLQSIIFDKGEYIITAYEYKESERHHYQFTLGLKGSNPNTETYIDAALGIPLTISEIPNGFFFKMSSRYYAYNPGFGRFKVRPRNFQGYYFEPEGVLGFYNRNTVYRSFIQTIPATIIALESKKVFYLGFTTNVGLQRTFRKMLVDVHLGFGVGYSNLERDEPYSYDFNHRGLYARNGRLSLAFQFDAKVGGIF